MSDDIDIAAEALCATTGLFQSTPVTPQQGRQARALEREWRRQVAAFIDERKWRAFRWPAPPDHMRTYDALVKGIDAERRATLVSLLADEELGVSYLQCVARSIGWLLSQWATMTLDTPLGERQVAPGVTEAMRCASLLSVVDSPDRVIDEMRAGTLTTAQAEGMGVTYPLLLKLLKASVWDALVKRYRDAAGYALPFSRELLIRRLVGLAPELSLEQAQPPPAKTPPPSVGAIDFKSRLQTKAQSLAER